MSQSINSPRIIPAGDTAPIFRGEQLAESRSQRPAAVGADGRVQAPGRRTLARSGHTEPWCSPWCPCQTGAASSPCCSRRGQSGTTHTEARLPSWCAGCAGAGAGLEALSVTGVLGLAVRSRSISQTNQQKGPGTVCSLGTRTVGRLECGTSHQARERCSWYLKPCSSLLPVCLA